MKWLIGCLSAPEADTTRAAGPTPQHASQSTTPDMRDESRPPVTQDSCEPLEILILKNSWLSAEASHVQELLLRYQQAEAAADDLVSRYGSTSTATDGLATRLGSSASSMAGTSDDGGSMSGNALDRLALDLQNHHINRFRKRVDFSKVPAAVQTIHAAGQTQPSVLDLSAPANTGIWANLRLQEAEPAECTLGQPHHSWPGLCFVQAHRRYQAADMNAAMQRFHARLVGSRARSRRLYQPRCKSLHTVLEHRQLNIPAEDIGYSAEIGSM